MVTFEIGLNRDCSNWYRVLVGGQLWCTTQSDDDGMKLAIAIIKLNQQKEQST